MKRPTVLAAMLILFSAAALNAQLRIRFAPGRTSATVSGAMPRLADRTFVLGARKGQTMSGNVSSRGDCVKFDNGTTSMSVTTAAGNNLITLRNDCNRSASFTFTVSINYTD